MLIYWNKNIRGGQWFFLQMDLKHILLMGIYPERKCSVIYSKRHSGEMVQFIDHAKQVLSTLWRG